MSKHFRPLRRLMTMKLALPALMLTAIFATACSSSPPAHSAPQACADFRAWIKDQGGDNLGGEQMSVLKQGVREAPSGQLYEDLDTVLVNVQNALAHPGYGPDLSIDGDVQAVQNDCASINPG